MSHSLSNGNPFSLDWSISLRREAYRHAELNRWLSFSQGRTSRQHSRWKDLRNNQQQKRYYLAILRASNEKECLQPIASVSNYFFFLTIFSVERTNDRILAQSMVSPESWVIENRVSSLTELSDLNVKSHGSSIIWGKMQIHGSLIFTYTWNQGELDFEAGLLK